MSLWMLVVFCQKRAVHFPKGPFNLIKMDLSLISHEFLICDMHMQLLFGETLQSETSPQNKIYCQQLCHFVTSCW